MPFRLRWVRVLGKHALGIVTRVGMLAAVCLTLGGCEGAKRPSKSQGVLPRENTVPRSSAWYGTVVALLANRHLLAVNMADGVVRGDLALGTAPDGQDDFRHTMALSNDGRMLFVLLPPDEPGTQRLAVVDIQTGQLRTSYLLVEHDVVYRGLSTGPQSGQLYLFGNRVDGTDTRAVSLHTNPEALSVVVTVLNPSTGETVRSETVKPAEGRQWYVYQGLVSRDEQRIFISYHGTDTTGIDWFNVTNPGFELCQPLSDLPASDCMRVHGGFALLDDGLLAATGGPLVRIDAGGRIIGELDTPIAERNHVMEFAFDPSTGQVYAAGSCLYAGGLSVAELTSGHAELLKPPSSQGSPSTGQQLCGEQLAIGTDSLLVVAQPQDLLFLDRHTGRTVRTTTESPTRDLIVIPGA